MKSKPNQTALLVGWYLPETCILTLSVLIKYFGYWLSYSCTLTGFEALLQQALKVGGKIQWQKWWRLGVEAGM